MFKIKKLKKFAVIQDLEETLELKDLTIFMGDNSAGKSYMAMLIHSFITMTRGYQDINFLKAINAKYASSSLLQKLSTNINNVLVNELDTLIISFDKNDKDTLKEIINFSNEYLLKKYLTQALFEEFNIQDIEIELNNVNKLLPKILLIKYTKNFETTSIEILIDKKERTVANFQGDFPQEIILTETINSVLSTLIEKIVKKTLPINSVYLPASRTGYLQTYRTLANNAIFKNYDVDDKNHNHLSIIVRFFISQLNNNTSFTNNEFSDFIEKFIINGDVNIYKDNNNIEFQLSNGKQIDLNYLSSTISELIPLVVFLKRGLIRKNGLIVIEEPEAHLSFKNQKLIAKLIALFLQNNIKVLITTHSDFLIYEINNLIMKETINNLKNNNSSGHEYIGINHKQVGLYNFILEGSGSTIKKVNISKHGISNPYIFDNTYSLIKEKNELIDLLDILNAKNNN